MNTREQSLPGLPSERPTAEAGSSSGFYHCNHCGDVVTPSLAQIELAENAPEPCPSLKCPHCHKHTVHWRMPSPARTRQCPRPVSVANGRELFAGICQMLSKM